MRKIVFILLAVVICFSPVGVSSQNIFQKAANKISSWFSGGEKERASDKTGHIDITQLTLDENLSIPDLGKQARKIRTAQSREMKRLQKARLSDLKLIRNYEVLKATLSASNLFLPNDTVLSDRADIYLRPFLAALRVPDFYHVMLVMHSDDTGSEAYSLDLTRARAHAVRDWFTRNGGNTDFVVIYEAGAFDPIASNETLEGRARNRRLDIYLIPGEKMVDIMVRAEDASKINRIVERFKLATVDAVSIKRDIEQSKADKTAPTAPEQEKPDKAADDRLLDDLLGAPVQKEEQASPNPAAAKTEKSRPSAPTSEKQSRTAEGTAKSPEERPSVREELREIRESRQKEAAEPGIPEPTPAKAPKKQPTTTHKQPSRKKPKKAKER